LKAPVINNEGKASHETFFQRKENIKEIQVKKFE